MPNETPEDRKRQKWKADAVREIRRAQLDGRAPHPFAEAVIELLEQRKQISLRLGAFRAVEAKKAKREGSA
jgi:hypothetical protein